jgi:F-type H+-transporting ATPase subunit delta
VAEIATLARPYANALFDLARGDNALNEWSNMLSVLLGVVEEQKVGIFLQAPENSAREKALRLSELCGDEIDDRGRKLLLALAEHDRLSLLSEVSAQFESLKAEAERLLAVKIQSARELSQNQIESFSDALKRRYGKEISLEIDVNNDLIGGAVITAGDMVIDGSIRGKLNKLRDSLAGA